VTVTEDSRLRDEGRRRAVRRALEFVDSGMTLGLGSGSTASIWIKRLGQKVREGKLRVRAIATSRDSELLVSQYNIPLIMFEECRYLDLAVDGVDEIGPGMALIKEGGRRLLREKIGASAATCFIVVAEDSKVVERLERLPLPSPGICPILSEAGMRKPPICSASRHL
jgi:ribose 5-phosphate isomerase A